MLYAFSCLQICIDLRSRRSWDGTCQLLPILEGCCACLPAAAAGSSDGFLASEAFGLWLLLPIGLRLTLGADCLADGDLERRSKRERRGSGSVWSKRDRFDFRSSSPMIIVPSLGLRGQ